MFFRKFLSFLSLSLLSFISMSLTSDEWIGQAYENNSLVQLDQGGKLLKSIELHGDEQILDVGCGNGVIATYLAQQVPEGRVIGIDPSASMLALAKGNESDNLIFLEGSAEDFEFSTQFDHIFATYVMHWVPDQEKALENMYRHLKPGGELHLILVPSKEGLPFDAALTRTLASWKEDFKGFKNPQLAIDLETYRRLFMNAGFRIQAFHYVLHETTHANKEKLGEWIQQWLPHGKHLPEGKKEPFFVQLMEAYAQEAGYPPNFSEEIKWEEYTHFAKLKKPF